MVCNRREKLAYRVLHENHTLGASTYGWGAAYPHE